MMRLPRLLTADGKGVQRVINPMRVSLNLNIVPLSYASIRLSKDEFLPARGLVEIFTPFGSAGVYRVRSPQDAYGEEITTAELEHAIAEVGDYLVKEKIEEMVSAESAMRRVFSYYKGKLWKLGSVSALGTGQIALSLNYERILDAMISILSQKTDCMMSFDFSTVPWTVNIVSKGTSIEAEGRLSRNITSARVSYDDTEMCTRVYYEVVEDGGDSHWESRDADTLSQYGVIEKELSVASGLSSTEINAVVNTYLREHKKPRVGVSIQGNDLSAITGESLDRFAIGKKFRLVIPEYNVVLEDIIVSLSWDDLYRMPKSVSINIGDSEDTVVTYIHNLDSSGSTGGGGGGGGKKKTDDTWREYVADFYKTDKTVGLYAKRVDRADHILEKAGLDINSQGVLIYAETGDSIMSRLNVTANSITATVNNKIDGVNSSISQTASKIRAEVNSTARELRSSITQEANRISLVVEGTGSNAHVKAASIVAGINDQSGSYVKIQANKINLDGYVTVSELNATNATISNLRTGETSFSKLVGTRGDFNSIYLGGSQLSKNTYTINGTRYQLVTWYG